VYCLDGHNGNGKAAGESKPQTEVKTVKVFQLDWAAIYEKAKQAGIEAGNNAIPAPMVVQQHANVLDDNSPVKQSWYVSDGVCGFAWVKIRPGTHPFARWLKQNKLGHHDDYAGGLTIWVSEHGQSYERKCAHAGAMARVLDTIDGLRAYADSRLD
jgi:hypothetical protein